MIQTLHRNSQKRLIGKNYIYFITAKTLRSHTYFQELIFCDLWVEELKLCKKLKQFELYAFCLNHDHFHMLIKPSAQFSISQIMQALKKNITQDINKITSVCHEGANSNSRLRQVNLDPFLQQLRAKYPQPDFSLFRWQKSFYDHIIRDKKDFDNHLKYTVYNFSKHDLPNNWQYTSLNFPELIDFPK